MKWIGTQTIYDNVRLVKSLYLTGDLYLTGSLYDSTGGTGTLPIVAGDLTMYNAVNDGNPTISVGSSATNRAEFMAEYHSGVQTFNRLRIKTYSSSGATNAGRITFYVDETTMGEFRDSGLNIPSDKSLSIGGTNIIADSSGTATLSNIDALDATTIATFNAALTAGDITSVVAGDYLSGGGTSGDVTLNVSNVTLGAFEANTIQLSTESFADNDVSLMTSAAIADKIEAYGYGTGTGDITSVTVETDGDNFEDTSGAVTFGIKGGNGLTTALDGADVNIDATNASASTKGIVELATTAEATTGTDTARAVTAAGLTAHVDDRYQYVFMNHHAFADNSDMSGDDWMFPKDARGVEYYEYDDLTDSVANEATSFTLPRLSQGKGIIVPYDCTLVGFYGSMISSSNHQGALALWTFTPAWGVGGSAGVTATRRMYATSDLAGGSSNYTSRPAKVTTIGGSVGAGTDTAVDLSAGDAILPSMVCPVDGETTDLKCSFTIVLKIKLPDLS